MSAQRSIARRDVLALLCASGVMACGLVQAAESGAPPGVSTLAKDMDFSAIHALGAQYRKGHPNDADSELISKLLRNRSLTPEKIAARLRLMVTDDYRRDRIVELSGWHLSRTEARVFTALSDYLS
jgi:hypothetical protein